MPAFSKNQKEIIMRQVADSRFFQGQQGVLPGIDINTMDLCRIVQQVFQRIAAGTGDHYNFTLLVQLQHLPVATWVFPTGIVDEVAAVDLAKDPVLDLINFFGHDVCTLDSGQK
jgi:hypothetical protein